MTFETWLKEDKFRTQVTLPFKEYLKEGLRKEPHELPDHPTPALKTGRETSKERAETRRARRENTQRVIPYACFFGAYRLAMVAPPVARIGELKKPVRKRKAISMT